MTLWILAVLALFVVQTFVPNVLHYLHDTSRIPEVVNNHMTVHEDLPEPSPYGRRAARALANLKESLPVFLAVALLHEARGTVDDSVVTGAMVYLVGRVLYLPAYMSAVWGLRTAMWTVSWIGLGLMIAGLFTSP